jgi:hypothetical protein
MALGLLSSRGAPFLSGMRKAVARISIRMMIASSPIATVKE